MNKILLYIISFICIIHTEVNAQGNKPSPSPPRSKLTPEQQDLKLTATYLTDGRQFTDAEIIQLSHILKPLKFKKKWKEIKNKAEGNYPLNASEKRIYRKIIRRQEKVRNKLNRFWEKKNRPKTKEELKRYKAMKKQSKKWNDKKRQ